MTRTPARKHNERTMRTVAVLALTCLALAAQETRYVHLTVTDTLNRFVTGLDTEHFEVAGSTPSTLQGPDSTIAIAVVGAPEPQPAASVVHASTVSEALQLLAASSAARKALILAIPATDQAIPAAIHVLRIDAANLAKAVIEAKNTYTLGFTQPAVPVTLKAPRGLPPLKANLN